MQCFYIFCSLLCYICHKTHLNSNSMSVFFPKNYYVIHGKTFNFPINIMMSNDM